MGNSETDCLVDNPTGRCVLSLDLKICSLLEDLTGRRGDFHIFLTCIRRCCLTKSTALVIGTLNIIQLSLEMHEYAFAKKFDNFEKYFGIFKQKERTVFRCGC